MTLRDSFFHEPKRSSRNKWGEGGGGRETLIILASTCKLSIDELSIRLIALMWRALLRSRKVMERLLRVLLKLFYIIQHNTIQYNTTQYNTTQYNTIQYNTIQYNTIQYNTIQRNTIQHNTIQYNTIQYKFIQDVYVLTYKLSI